MNVELKEISGRRLATVSHLGPYNQISTAFQKLGALAAPAGLLANPSAEMIGVYYDDPESKPAYELRSEAGLSVLEEVALPKGLGESRIPKGRYATTVHKGSYAGLGDTWAKLMGQWIPEQGLQIQEGVSFEIYRNNPQTTSEEELITELYVAVI